MRHQEHSRSRRPALEPSPSENRGGARTLARGPTITPLGSEVTDGWGDHGSLGRARDSRVCFCAGARNAGREQKLHLAEPGCRQTRRAHPCAPLRHPPPTSVPRLWQEPRHHLGRYSSPSHFRSPRFLQCKHPQAAAPPTPSFWAKARPVSGPREACTVTLMCTSYLTSVHYHLSDS